MRISWRWSAVMLLVAAWPQIGCMQLPTGKTVQDVQPVDRKLAASPKQDLTAAEIAQTWQNKANTLELAGKTNDAIAMYEQLRQQGGPQAMGATRNLAQIYDRRNDLERAEQEYRLLLRQNSRDADTLCSLGNIYYRRGQWYAAEKFFRDAVYYQAEHKASWAGLGWTLAQQGEYESSIEALAKVVSRAEAYSKVASVLNLQGKRADALRALQTAVSMEPNNGQLRAELARMEASAPVVPQVAARVPPPIRKDQRGNVELEDVPRVSAMNDGTSRLMEQRPTLPPLPDVDLTSGTGPPR